MPAVHAFGEPYIIGLLGEAYGAALVIPRCHRLESVEYLFSMQKTLNENIASYLHSAL